jgi:hypothetical protein
MKIVGIIALALGMTVGTIGSAYAERGHDGDVLHGGIGTECWMETERGSTYEVCGTIFAGEAQADDSPRGE